jgi:FKBP-type peptidyl-prolyl cis-trans isomerase
LASLGAFAFAGGDAGSARAADAGDWSSPGLGVIPDRPANYVKSPLGVTYEQINEGVGDFARPGDVAVFHWILRRANGYFIYGSVDCGIGCGNGDPSEYVLGPDGRLIPGLDELLTGMRPGEKRRALVPPELGYVSKGLEPQPPEFGQKRQVEVHAREPLVFEVKLIKVRNKRAA